MYCFLHVHPGRLQDSHFGALAYRSGCLGPTGCKYTVVVISPCTLATCFVLFLLQFVYCQVCCEPFHKFCLEENERPLEDQLENWCCRRCKFCHVCGRQHQATKVDLVLAAWSLPVSIPAFCTRILCQCILSTDSFLTEDYFLFFLLIFGK